MGIPEKPPKKKVYDAEKLFGKVLEGGTTKSSINQEEIEIPCQPVRTRWNPSNPRLTNHQKENELEELRNSRSAVVERLVVERSSSTVGRLHLADDVWVTEKCEDKVTQERQKARQELEEVKQARLDMVEPQRPSSRMEDQARQEALKELEEIKAVRCGVIENTKRDSEVSKRLC